VAWLFTELIKLFTIIAMGVVRTVLDRRRADRRRGCGPAAGADFAAGAFATATAVVAGAAGAGPPPAPHRLLTREGAEVIICSCFVEGCGVGDPRPRRH
jgi:hypothetical protein